MREQPASTTEKEPASFSGTAQWAEEGSALHSELVRDGYEPTRIRRWVMAETWAVLMWKRDDQN